MIYFVRHGQTNWNIEHKIQGQSDIPLNETGKEQARLIAPKLTDLKIDRIISSDLSRALETAQIINTHLKLQITLDTRLREFKYGQIEGVPSKDLTDEIWFKYHTSPELIDAEAPWQAFERTKDFIDEYAHSPSCILAVTHGGFIRMATYYKENPTQPFDGHKYWSDYVPRKFANTDLIAF